MKQPLGHVSRACVQHYVAPAHFSCKVTARRTPELLSLTAQADGRAGPRPCGRPPPERLCPLKLSPPSPSPLGHSFWLHLFCDRQHPCPSLRSLCLLWALCWSCSLGCFWNKHAISSASWSALESRGRAHPMHSAQSAHPILQFPEQREQRQNPTHAAGSYMDAKS